MEGGQAVWYSQVLLDPPLTGSAISVQVSHETNQTVVWFGEERISFTPRYPLALGLVTQDSDILFDELSWSQ